MLRHYRICIGSRFGSDKLIVTYWGHIATEIWINIGSANGLLPDGTCINVDFSLMMLCGIHPEINFAKFVVTDGTAGAVPPVTTNLASWRLLVSFSMRICQNA